RLVLHEELGHSERCAEILRVMEGRPSLAESHDVVFATDGQNLAIAPEIGPAGVKGLPGEHFANPLQIVAYEKRLTALRADVVNTSCFVFAMAGGALEVLDVHSVS